jgi:hypothetical protein
MLKVAKFNRRGLIASNEYVPDTPTDIEPNLPSIKPLFSFREETRDAKRSKVVFVGIESTKIIGNWKKSA